MVMCEYRWALVEENGCSEGVVQVSQNSFRVDLRGLVDLLSRNLYSSPRVYVRELLQNAVDAVTARRLEEPTAPARVSFRTPTTTGDGTLQVHDTGVGLTESQVHDFLATIGGSSKRDEFGFSRSEFLGQFGIGLLSCFMIGDAVEVVTRHFKSEQSVRWIGFSDGRYEVSPGPPMPEPGTIVTLRPLPEMRQWVESATVASLVTDYGALLPVEVSVDAAAVTKGALPWANTGSVSQRWARLRDYCQQTFGFEPLAVVDLSVPIAGLTGVAFVLPMPVNPAVRGGHRVYLRRMLMTDSALDLLPEWAFFARCVVDTTQLHPIASREGLYDDELLAATREALGAQLRDWLVRLGQTDPRRLQQFLRVHHLGAKALAVHDLEMLRLVDAWLPFETSFGTTTLADLRARTSEVNYTLTVEEFKQLAGVASAQGVAVVNGGYTYDIEIMERLRLLDPKVKLQQLSAAELAKHFTEPAPDQLAALGGFIQQANAALQLASCRASVRLFDPPAIAALYLVSRDAMRNQEYHQAEQTATPLWRDMLATVGMPATDAGPELVLNLRHPVVQAAVRLPSAELIALAVQALYGQALLSGDHPVRPADKALLDGSFLGLLAWATRGKDSAHG